MNHPPLHSEIYFFQRCTPLCRSFSGNGYKPKPVFKPEAVRRRGHIIFDYGGPSHQAPKTSIRGTAKDPLSRVGLVK